MLSPWLHARRETSLMITFSASMMVASTRRPQLEARCGVAITGRRSLRGRGRSDAAGILERYMAGAAYETQFVHVENEFALEQWSEHGWPERVSRCRLLRCPERQDPLLRRFISRYGMALTNELKSSSQCRCRCRIGCGHADLAARRRVVSLVHRMRSHD